jgi:hypothetical protein
MKPRRIVVVIDELYLHGFDGSQRREIGDALEHELGRLFAAGSGGAYQNRQIERIVTPPVAVAPRANARALGASVAERVWGGVIAVPTPHRGGR